MRHSIAAGAALTARSDFGYLYNTSFVLFQPLRFAKLPVRMIDAPGTPLPKKLILAATIVYWVALEVAMHVPQIPRPLEESDKILHFTSYALLALLVATTWSLYRPFHWRQALIVAVLLSLNGVIDETTQPYVGRACDVRDWMADTAGVVAALAAFLVIRAVLRRPDSA